jgi:prepilin-type processing-associated H-X9-DG protein
MNNSKQLALSWTMYADDSANKLAPNYAQGTSPGGSATQLTPNAYPCWVGGVMTLPTGVPTTENTNTMLLVNHDIYPNAAFLGPYIKAPNSFKCPADQSLGPVGGGIKEPRCRSVSMNNFVGNPSLAMNVAGTSAYPTYLKSTDIHAPTLTFVTLDEREDSINDGTLFTDVNGPQNITDIPASYHNGAAGFSFADGHAEIHKWVSSVLREPIQAKSINNQGAPVGSPTYADSIWLCQHAVGLLKGSFP